MSEQLNAKKLKLEDSIEYQEGNVVSRKIILKSTGTVTIFPFDAIVQLIDGKAEITISGDKNILEKGDMIILPANYSPALNAIERFKMVLTMIRS